jgi:MFS transporter, PAT family, solute carrier family 33 (acetyl-CoA transportor), member 1
LKLTEKGLRTEQLSVMVTIDFVVQLFGGYYAARWAIGNQPLRSWLYAFWARLAFAITSMLIVHAFPIAPVPTSFLVLVAFNYIVSQFST